MGFPRNNPGPQSKAKPFLPQAISYIISQFGPYLKLWRELPSASELLESVAAATFRKPQDSMLARQRINHPGEILHCMLPRLPRRLDQ